MGFGRWRTREPLGWSGARLATTDLATTIETLRATGDGDIALVGGSALARAATRASAGIVNTMPCPSAHDRARNRHRSGIAWSKSTVRVILTNPRYTGRQVWNKPRTDEVLLTLSGWRRPDRR
ncbi:recombinase family protein [Micromonospora sp. NPDC053740]|uniref:recombinase family protein n=1 Tax=Micromonospora TaxID=1873 RepID=UPI001EE8FD6B|nr:recombinase family protein [Micromonospora alfalfae]MCG5465492.1 recombinase family protein [Micromonospora alfalfae]